MHVILFDGVCNLCNNSVNFIIDRDKKNIFQFAALQSEAGKKLLLQHQLPADKSDSIVLIKNGKVYQRSAAALEIARHLQGFWSFMYVFKIIPDFISDIFYNFIAKNRYRFFGQQEACRIPTPELKAKFLV
ncbi:MAG: thiol-disulfide oxidoreductase DCC family protein [Verrucomicrobia bacterium]|nr:thiol-disulfide oxidoreductase DCC family protein [Cytophagales bacterium]